jgi:hypothetical protein
MFGTVNRAMLASGTAKGHLQVLKSALQVSSHRSVHKSVTILQKSVHILLFFQKVDYGSILARELFVWLISARIMDGATVKNKAAAVA